MNQLEHKLRLLQNTINLNGGAGVYLHRKGTDVVDFEVIFLDLIRETTTGYKQVWDGMPDVYLSDEVFLVIGELDKDGTSKP